MATCPSCGHTLAAGSAKCPDCGAALDRRARALYARVARLAAAAEKLRSDELPLEVVDDALEAARTALADGHSGLARDHLEEAAKQLVTLQQVARYQRPLAAAAAVVEKARTTGANVSNAEACLAAAADALGGGDFARLRRSIAEVRPAVALAMRRARVERVAARAVALLEKEQRAGSDVADATKALAAARTALDAYRPDEATTQITAAQEALALARKRRVFEEAAARLRAEVQELAGLEVDTKPVTEALRDAEEQARHEDFEAAWRRLHAARREATKARHQRERDLMIQAVEKIVGRLGGMDPAEARRLLREVESSFRAGREVDVDQLLEDKMRVDTTGWVRDLSTRISDARAAMTPYARAGFDVVEIERKLREARDILDAGQASNAEPLLVSAEASIEELRREVMERADAAVAETADLRQKMVAAGVSSDAGDALLQEARALRAAGDGFGALQQARAAKAAFEQARLDALLQDQKRANEAMRASLQKVQEWSARLAAARVVIEQIALTGLDVGGAVKAVVAAEAALVSGEQEDVDAQLGALEAMTTRLRSHLEESVRGALAEANAAINNAVAKGAQVADAETALTEAREDLNRGALADALRMARLAKRAAEEGLTRFLRERERREQTVRSEARDRLARVRSVITDLAKVRVEVEGSQGELRNIEKSLETGDLEAALSRLESLEATVLGLERAVAISARDTFERAQGAVAEAVDRGLDPQRARSLLLNAEKALAAELFDEALEFARAAQREADELIRRVERESATRFTETLRKARQRLDSVQAVLRDLTRADIEIMGSADVMRRAAVAIDAGRADEAVSLLDGLETSARDLAEGLSEAARVALARADEKLEEAAARGLDVGRAVLVSRTAQEAVRDGRPVEALEYSKVIADIIADADGRQRLRQLESEVTSLRSQVDKAKAWGIDLTAAEDVLDRARKKLRSRQFEGLGQRVGEVEGGLADARRVYLTTTLEGLERLHAEAQRAGVATPEPEELIREARAALEAGDLDRLEEAVLLAGAAVDEERKALLAIRAKQDFERVEAAVASIRSLGEDLGETVAMLEKAQKSMASGAWEDALKSLQRARDEAEARTRAALQSRFGQQVSHLVGLIDDARRAGASTTEAERLAGLAQTALDRGDVGGVDLFITQAEMQVRSAVQSALKDKRPQIVLRLPTAGLHAGVWNRYGFEVANVGSLAADHVELRFVGDVEVRGLEPIDQLAPGETKRLEVGLRPQGEGAVPLGVEVSYRRTLDGATYEVKENSELRSAKAGTYTVDDVFLIHGDGRLIFHEGRTTDEEMDRDIMAGMLTAIQSFVKESFGARAGGGVRRLEFGDGFILVERGQLVDLAAVVSGQEPLLLPLYMAEAVRKVEAEYGEQLKDWSGSLRDLPGIAEFLGRLLHVTDARGEQVGTKESMVAEVLTSIDAVKEAGLDSSDAERLLAEARRAAEGDLGTAWQMLEEAKRATSSAVERARSAMEEAVATAELSVAEIESFGVDASALRKLLHAARNALDQGNLAAAADALRDVRAGVGQAKERLVLDRMRPEVDEVASVLDQAQAEGADTGNAREILNNARAALEAGNLRAVESLARVRAMVADARRRRETERWQAEVTRLTTTVKEATQLGVSLGDAEDSMRRAQQALAAGNVAEAARLIERSHDATRARIQDFMHSRAPKLGVTLPSAALQAGEWSRYTVEVVNRGNLEAKDVEVRLVGPFETKGLEKIERLGPNERKLVEVAVRPTQAGASPVDVEIGYQRPLDDARFELTERKEVRVAAEGTYTVHDIFLIHTDGRLVVHETRRPKQQIDEDIFSGMLTVVQDFVKDSFREQAGTGLRRMDFGENKILMERGPHAYLAAVTEGGEPRLLPLYMVDVMSEVESRYGRTLDAWSGLYAQLEGIEEVIRKLLMVTDAEGAPMGELEQSPVTAAARAAMQLGAADILEKARKAIEAATFEAAVDHLGELSKTASSIGGELTSQVQQMMAATSGEVIEVSDERVRAAIRVLTAITTGLTAARRRAGLGPEWPLRRAAVRTARPEVLDAAASFRPLIVRQANLKELDVVKEGTTWRGLRLDATVHDDVLDKAYPTWARRISMMLKSRDPWKIKEGLDSGKYAVYLDGQAAQLDPSMVSFTESVPPHVMAEEIDGGFVYLDTRLDDELLGEGYARLFLDLLKEMRKDLALPPEAKVAVRAKLSDRLTRLLLKHKQTFVKEALAAQIDLIAEELTDLYVVETKIGDEEVAVGMKPWSP